MIIREIPSSLPINYVTAKLPKNKFIFEIHKVLLKCVSLLFIINNGTLPTI